MPCLLGLLAYFFPRVVIILIFLTSNYLAKAYQTVLWPVLGFLFMPLTTLAYAFGMNSNGGISGLYLVLVVLAVLIDLGILGHGAQRTTTVATRRVRR
ncbi:MAG: hypothetical protein KF745_14955 [Phycisphaeraceae bacterium]|nr:hypothetical protein [Phycisphaeraceae bacterium]